MNDINKCFRFLIDIFIPIALIALMYPAIISQYPILVKVVVLMQWISIVVAVYLMITYKIYKDKFYVMYLFFFVLQLLITMRNNGMRAVDMSGLYTNYVMATLCIYGIKKYPKKMVSYFVAILSCWVIMNTLTWRAGGAYKTSNGQMGFFLGTKTSITYYQILALYFINIYRSMVKEKYKIYVRFLELAVVLSVILYNLLQPISTSLLCIGTYLVMSFLFSRRRFNGHLVFSGIFVSMIMINFLIVFFRIQEIFASFIENVLKEDASLNSRTMIWEIVLYNIIQKPILGHGTNSNITFSLGINSSFNTSAHNQILNWLFVAGIIGFVYIMLIIFHCIKINCKLEIESMIFKAIAVAFISFSVLWISEQFNSYIVFTAFLIFCDKARNLQQYEIEEKKRIKFYFG